ncbi:gliding motility lipoprotein GldD [Capnocytophaga canis]|uniref:gliding motility lipoprotein GldD n=1 Tax=Capnocytophaga canis TaxID=1848903 RepID=UPI001561C593|nr:gliding motility lipoprotein GldD [Capnocytophaga canis]
MRSLLFITLIFTILSCEETALPKPKAALRLEYPQAEYKSYAKDYCPFEFETNTSAFVKTKKDDSCDFDIEYPAMKATIYISYKKVKDNIRHLLRDAQKFTFEHTIKADNIASNQFVNDSTRVYGMFYQVYGNAASQAQFYATDSTTHFISGSVYFKVVPNYDSIQPASHYLEKDVRRIMETLRWK